MNTFLDLLIVVVMALTAVSLVSMVLMFLVKNRKVRRVCFYIVAALGIYMGYVGIRINRFGFMPQIILAALMAAISISAIVLERTKKDNDRRFLLCRGMASAALIVGMLNAFV